MKGAVAIGPLCVIALLVGIWRPVSALTSSESQVDLHTKLEQARARRHLRTIEIGPNRTDSAVAIPEELTPFVDGDEIPLYVDTADLEETGRLGYVLVVGTEDSGDKTMRIISRAASGALSVVMNRDDVIVCDECGGMDRRASICLAKGAIEIQNTSGDAYGGHEMTCLFRYSKASSQWLLVDATDFVWGHNTLEDKVDTSVRYQTAKDFGIVSLANPKVFDYCY